MQSFRLWLVMAAMLIAPAGAGAQVLFGNSGPTSPQSQRPVGVTGPVPAALKRGKHLFLSNAGADAGLFPHPFSGTQDRAYNDLYAGLAKSGGYQMVGNPARADLVLELSLNAPLGSIGGDKEAGTADPLPTFKLVIYDRPTHYILWTISQTIDPANLQKTHDRNFDVALDSVLTQFEAITK